MLSSSRSQKTSGIAHKVVAGSSMATLTIILGRNRNLAHELEALDIDLWIVHDSQPYPVNLVLRSFQQAIWHCHIDSSTTTRTAWNDLQRYITGNDRLVFCLPEYVNGRVPKERIRFVRPAIDALMPKILPLPLPEANSIHGKTLWG